MTESEVSELLKTHRISIARSRSNWTNQEARALHQRLSEMIQFERRKYQPAQRNDPYNPQLGSGPSQMEELKAIDQRIAPLIDAQERLKRENTTPQPTIHLIAKPI